MVENFHGEDNQRQGNAAEKGENDRAHIHQCQRDKVALLRALGLRDVHILPQFSLHPALLDAQCSEHKWRKDVEEQRPIKPVLWGEYNYASARPHLTRFAGSP